MQIFLLFIMLLLELFAAFCRWAFPAICLGILLGLYNRVDLARDPQLISQVVSWGFTLLRWGRYVHAGLMVLRLLAPVWERFFLGVRKPSSRELVTLEMAYRNFAHYAVRTTGVKFRYPRTFLVCDTTGVQIRFIGQKLVVDRAIIGSHLLEPLLAHELGHYNSSDRLTRVLLRLFPPMGCTVGCIFGLAMGFGALCTAPLWRIYWRNREFAADLFAARLGQRDALSTYSRPTFSRSTRRRRWRS